MKKLIALLVGATLMQTVAYAKIISVETKCGTDGKISISGTLDAEDSSSSVGLRIMKKNSDTSDLTGVPGADLTITEYIAQAEVNKEDKSFSFELLLSGVESGKYNARLKGDDFDSYEDLELYYVKALDYQVAVTTANGALADFASFKNACSTGDNAIYLGFDEKISEETDADEALEILYNSVKNSGLSDDRVQTITLWRMASLVAMLNDGELDIEAYKNYFGYFGDATRKWLDFVLNSEADSAVSDFEKLLKEKNITTVSELGENLGEALVLTVTKHHNGVGNIGNVLKDFSSLTGITTASETKVYQKVAGKDYGSLESLLEAYKEAKKNTQNAGGGSSSGGSSGGSSGVQITVPGNNNSGNKTPVKMFFLDLDSVEWAYEAITALADKGIINGRSETSFAPMDTVKREEFIKLLVCASGYENNSYDGGNFADVESGAWYEKYICIGAEKGIVNGVDDTRFGVGENISRQDMAVIIYRMLKNKGIELPEAELTFADAEQISDYAKEAISRLAGSGFVSGTGNNAYNPTGTATRAEAAQILYNVLSLIN